MSGTALSEQDRLRRVRLRNRATLWVLAGAALLFYALTILRIG